MSSAAASSVRRSFERPLTEITRRSFSSALRASEGDEARQTSARIAIPFSADSAKRSLMDDLAQAETRARVQFALYPTLSQSPPSSYAASTTWRRLEHVAGSADPAHFRAAVDHEHAQHVASSKHLLEIGRSEDAAPVKSMIGGVNHDAGAISPEDARKKTARHQQAVADLLGARRLFAGSRSSNPPE